MHLLLVALVILGAEPDGAVARHRGIELVSQSSVELAQLAFKQLPANLTVNVSTSSRDHNNNGVVSPNFVVKSLALPGGVKIWGMNFNFPNTAKNDGYVMMSYPDVQTADEISCFSFALFPDHPEKITWVKQKPSAGLPNTVLSNRDWLDILDPHLQDYDYDPTVTVGKLYEGPKDFKYRKPYDGFGREWIVITRYPKDLTVGYCRQVIFLDREHFLVRMILCINDGYRKIRPWEVQLPHIVKHVDFFDYQRYEAAEGDFLLPGMVAVTLGAGSDYNSARTELFFSGYTFGSELTMEEAQAFDMRSWAQSK